jgi:branched-chain amino acid transport system permease protein
MSPVNPISTRAEDSTPKRLAGAGYEALILSVALLVIPVVAADYWLSVANLSLIAIVGAIGLNILVGKTGQVSIGQGAFMSVGAYTAANLIVRLHAPFWVSIPAGGAMAALVGVMVGLPSLRIRGIYLVISTLAAQVIIEWLINHVHAISGGAQASISIPHPVLFGWELRTQGQLYYFVLAFVVLAVVAALNLDKTRVGRAFVAIRDQDTAAEIMGIDIVRYKLIAFVISSFYAGVAGVLYSYFLGVASYEQFQIDTSIEYLAMIIIGGLGSVRGAILGAIFITWLPLAVRELLDSLGAVLPAGAKLAQYFPQVRLITFGACIIGFLVAEPEGLSRLWSSAQGALRRGHRS